MYLNIQLCKRSIRAMRSARTPSTHVVAPTICACSSSKGSRVPGQMGFAMASIHGAKAGLKRLVVASPCFRALRLDIDVPASVRGPRLLRLFLLLAVICFSELISAPLALTQPRSFPLPCPSKRVGVQLPQPAPRHAAGVQHPRLRPEERTVHQLA